MDDNDLDTQWADDMEARESAYDEFYEEPQTVIDCFIMAVDSQNKLSHISKTTIDIQNCRISGQAISNAFIKLRLPRQRLDEVLLFRISAAPEEVLSLYLGTDNTTIYAPGSDVMVGPSPRGLHKVNAIFLIGKEQESVNGTRRVRVTFARKTRRK